jgi:hypothetical protein
MDVKSLIDAVVVTATARPAESVLAWIPTSLFSRVS